MIPFSFSLTTIQVMSTPPTLPPKGPEYSNGGAGKHTPQRPSIPLPENLQELPTNEISRLLDSLDALKGYLVSLIQSELDKDVSDLNNVVEQIQKYIAQLEDLEKKKHATHTRIENLNSLSAQWQASEREMYSTLARFNRDRIYSILQQSVTDSQKLTESIQATFVSFIDTHDESSIQQFIRTYKDERKLFHLRNEKLHRFQEDRLGGLS